MGRRGATQTSGGARRAVVLRAGPPAARGGRRDAVVGVLGAVLLLVAAGLVFVLPDEEPFVPQFRVAFVTEESLPFPTQGTEEDPGIRPGGSHDFLYEIPHDNAFNILLRVSYRDDQPNTLPDRFELELIAPNGTRIGETRSFVTEDPRPKRPEDMLEDDDPTQPFTSPNRVDRLPFRIAPRPTQQVVEALSVNETLLQAESRILPSHTLGTQGTWIVRVHLVEAGGCPPPSEDPDEAFQAALCQQRAQERGGVEDPGNHFTVEQLSYEYYGVEIEPLEAGSA